MRQPLKLFLFLAFLLSFREASSTMVVVIYTRDGFWIGADSYRSGDNKRVDKVCKIHETRLGLVVKAGESQGIRQSGEDYSTDQEVESVISSSKDVSTLEGELKTRFKQDIEEELAFLVDQPGITQVNLKEWPMSVPVPQELVPMLTRQLTVIDTSQMGAPGKVLEVIPGSDSYENAGKMTYVYWAPAVLSWHDLADVYKLPVPPSPAVVMPTSMRELSYLTSYLKPNEWVQDHPEEALREILDKGHQEQPFLVGPPYSIVHIVLNETKLPTVEWVSRGTCPGWTKKIYRDNTLAALRDDQRRARVSFKMNQAMKQTDALGLRKSLVNSPHWQSPIMNTKPVLPFSILPSIPH